jgi:hypothetical protein
VFLSPAEIRAEFDRLGLAELAIANEYAYCLKDAYQIQLATSRLQAQQSLSGFRITNGELYFWFTHSFGQMGR